MTECRFDRRAFLGGAAGLGALALFGSGCSPRSQSARPMDEQAEPRIDSVVWGHCSPNCYGRCALRLSVSDGQVVRVESDSTGDDAYGSHQIRACLRGRSIRQVLNHPDRLSYPMKRVGERGEGKFERISWEEAISIIAENYRRILAEYGPASVFITNATGVQSKNINPFLGRFLNLNGGYLINDGGYSAHQTKTALPYLYGKRAGNSSSDVVNSKLVVMFGDNFAENKLGGAGDTFHLQRALEKGGAKVIVIDPRFSPTAAVHADEWIPIRPGTDAALVEGIAYVLITENLIDRPFLETYTIGYDEGSLPAGAPANKSYRQHILGEGPDGTPKTPAWASAITNVPEATIVSLAHQIAEAKPCCIMQGLGPQRQGNGEQTTRAICMLAILTGNVGIKGGNTGSIFGSYNLPGISVPQGKNPIKAKLPTFMYAEAVLRGRELTKKNAGIKGVDRLQQPIKFIWNYGGNSLTNQHGDINRTKRILKDTSLCEFIVVWDIMMTDSATYADILLPDLMPVEQPNFVAGEYNGDMGYLILGQPAGEPRFERKTLYQSLCLLAEEMDCLDEFSEGLDEEGWLRRVYTEAAEKNDYPTYDTLKGQGVYRRLNPKGSTVAFDKFRKDPQANPLETPSGKIEIYSERLAQIAATWELDPGDVIDPLPIYAPAVGGWTGEPDERYPLQMVGFHERGHAHSSFVQVETLRQANQPGFWINPADAAPRGIATGDDVLVSSPSGTLRISAKVTNRVMPGVTAMGQGMWFKADENGIDVGGCANTLTSHHPSPLAKAIPANTLQVQVRKAL
ncbi:molybdopterin-dependent oxidoreductase [Eggerthellaceae bacterium zg-997]|nr:molybdopterin-dependent oxidoreductase [Eggerthellaceae bacterium zg-997]